MKTLQTQAGTDFSQVVSECFQRHYQKEENVLLKKRQEAIADGLIIKDGWASKNGFIGFVLPNGTRVVVLSGWLFDSHERHLNDICEKADRAGLLRPDMKTAEMIQGQFSHNDVRDMSLNHIVILHDPPIVSAAGYINFLLVKGNPIHNDFTNSSMWGWPQEHGFAFVVPEEAKMLLSEIFPEHKVN